jgi:hypothetical protein
MSKSCQSGKKVVKFFVAPCENQKDVAKKLAKRSKSCQKYVKNSQKSVKNSSKIRQKNVKNCYKVEKKVSKLIKQELNSSETSCDN